MHYVQKKISCFCTGNRNTSKFKRKL